MAQVVEKRPSGRQGPLFPQINTITADDLMVQESMPLPAMILTCFSRNVAATMDLIACGLSTVQIENYRGYPCIHTIQTLLHIYTVYPKKYAHGFVALCFVVVMQSFIMNSHDVFIHIHQGCFAGTGAIVRLPQCQWSKPDGYGKISQCITTTKHSKAKTMCIFLGIYCSNGKYFSGAVSHTHRGREMYYFKIIGTAVDEFMIDMNHMCRSIQSHSIYVHSHS